MTNPSPNTTPFDQIVILPYQSNWLAEYRALVGRCGRLFLLKPYSIISVQRQYRD
jgi:hypothetical protein